MNALVVPSNREHSIQKFLDAWDGIGLEVFVIEDNPKRSFRMKEGVRHYAWSDIEELLGEKAWIFSHRDSAIRSFGFLMAYRSRADYIYTLDDDCFPDGTAKNFVLGHHRALFGPTRWTESYPGRRTRGLPYFNKGLLTNVVLNMGFWKKHPDLDAIQTLSGQYNDWEHVDYPSRIMPNGQYFPLCGMNMCFTHRAAPLMYFPLMGEGQPYRRFDDIWCGIIAKKICDHLGWLISCGEPYIIHDKASDPMVNLVKEAPGIAANEKFWETIDNVQLTAKTCVGCMDEIGQALGKESDEYLKTLGRAMSVWATLFPSP